MTALVVERSVHRTLDDHVILLLGPAPEQPGGHGWRERVGEALDVAGLLARVALDVDGALEATAQDHECYRRLYRDDPVDGAEVVDAERFHGCRRFLVLGEPGDEEPPRLVLHVPPNRERAWTAWLERVAEDVLALDRAILTTANRGNDE